MALALAAAACGADGGGETRDVPAVATTPPVATTEPAPSGAATTDAATTGELPAIVVESPSAGERVRSPVTVSGTADVFEANVTVRIAAGGEELAHTFTTATCGTGCRGDFSVAVVFKVEREKPGTIVVHDDAADTGRPPHEVRIPVTLAP